MRCKLFLQYAPSAWVRDKVRESLPMERRMNGAKWPAPHTVLPICWSLALRCTCGHPEAGGRGGLSPLSSAHLQISNFSSGRQTFKRWPFFWKKTSDLLSGEIRSFLGAVRKPFFDIAGSTWIVCLAPPQKKWTISLRSVTRGIKSSGDGSCAHFKWLFITLMDLVRGGNPVFIHQWICSGFRWWGQEGSHKEWHIYLGARWFDKDSYSELLQQCRSGASAETRPHSSPAPRPRRFTSGRPTHTPPSGDTR